MGQVKINDKIAGSTASNARSSKTESRRPTLTLSRENLVHDMAHHSWILALLTCSQSFAGHWDMSFSPLVSAPNARLVEETVGDWPSRVVGHLGYSKDCAQVELAGSGVLRPWL